MWARAHARTHTRLQREMHGRTLELFALAQHIKNECVERRLDGSVNDHARTSGCRIAEHGPVIAPAENTVVGSRQRYRRCALPGVRARTGGVRQRNERRQSAGGTAPCSHAWGWLYTAVSPPARGMRRLPRAGADAPSDGTNEVARSGATARDGAAPGRISAEVEKAAALRKEVDGGNERTRIMSPRRRVRRPPRRVRMPASAAYCVPAASRQASAAPRSHARRIAPPPSRWRAQEWARPHAPGPRPGATNLPAGHPEQ